MTTNVLTASGLTPAQQNRRSDILVIILCLVALIAGWFVKTAYQYRTATHDILLDAADATLGKATVVLPTAWVATTEPISGTQQFAMPVTYVDTGAASAYKTSFSADLRILETTPTDPTQTLHDYVDRAVTAHTKDLVGYQLLAEPAETTVNGAPARKIEYAYVTRPIDSQLRNAPPVVVRGIDYLVLKANHVYMITLTADVQAYNADTTRVLQAAIDSLQLP